MNAKLLFNVSAVAEVLVGVTLLILPAFAIGLFVGDGMGATGIAVSRIFGIALIALGIAAWETEAHKLPLAPRIGLCIYNLGIAVLLAILGTLGGMYAILLWPVAVLHTLLGSMMLWMILVSLRETSNSQ